MGNFDFGKLMDVGNFASNIVGGLLNLHQQKENRRSQNWWNQQQMEFNKAEAEASRAFNSAEAKKSRDFAASESEKSFNREKKAALEMWNLENAYNAPHAQVRRLISAGLNPNLFGGHNVGGSIAAASSSPLSPSPASSSPASAGNLSAMPTVPINFSNPFSSQNRLMEAQARNLDADTQRKQTLLPGEIQTQDLNLKLMGADIDLKSKNGQLLEEKTRQVGEDIKLTQQKVQESKAYADILSKQGEALQKELEHFEDRFVREMRALDDEHLLDTRQLNVMASTIRANMAVAANNYAQGRAADARALLDGVEYRIQSKYGMQNAKVHFDQETNRLSIMENESSVSVAETEKRQRILRRRNSEEGAAFVTNYLLDRLSMTSEAIGLSLGVGVNANSRLTR